MDAHLFDNLLAYSAQLASLTALAALLLLVVRIDHASVRYTYWRVVLALCVAMPWIQGRVAVPAAATPTADNIASTAIVASSPATAAATGPMAIGWLSIAAIVIVAGAVGRLLWMAVGVVRLRRLRAAGRIAPPCEEHEELQWAIGTRAEVRYVPDLKQPVTFGTRHPVVLLPESLLDRSPEIQRAVLSHELFHVRRHDWGWTIAEEIVRAILWFHPAVWWLVSRVQLAREEVVDELTVLATGQRKTYIEALLVFADEAPLTPAAAFARRRHLFRRMMMISKGVDMSARRIVASCLAMALIIAAAGWYVVGAFPLAEAAAAQNVMTNGPGPVERRAKPITPENPVPRRVFSTTPIYPPEAAAVGLDAVVALRITIDEAGRVAEVRGLDTFRATGRAAGSAESLRRAYDAVTDSAIDAARQWQYEAPAQGPISFEALIRFSPNAPATLVSQETGIATAVRGRAGVIGGPGPAGVVGGRPGTTTGGAVGGTVGGRLGASSVVAPPPPPPPPPPQALGQPVRVGGLIKQPQKTRHVPPVYPAIAQSARVQGVVIIEAVIAEDGRVSDARVLRSIPLLDQAALDAVRQWEFTPTLLNGVPVPVIMTMTVNFSLAEEQPTN